MGFFQTLFHRKRSPTQRGDAGLDAEHDAIRRAIERCDALRPAYDAGQLKLDGVVNILKRNDFDTVIIRKAIEESFGEDAAKRI